MGRDRTNELGKPALLKRLSLPAYSQTRDAAGGMVFACSSSSLIMIMSPIQNTRQDTNVIASFWKKMSRSIWWETLKKCLLIMIEKYQTEKKNIVGDKKENRTKFSFMKDSSAERSSKLFEVDHLVPLKHFVIALTNSQVRSPVA